MYKVIIVEDDPMVTVINRKYIERFSELEVVETFSDGKSALFYIKENPVDLIILDFFMPVMDGLEFLTGLRGIGGHQDVIMATAASDAKLIGKLTAMGLLDYLIKPFDYPRFKIAIKRFMKKKGTLDSRIIFTQKSLDKLFDREPQDLYGQYLDKGIQRNTMTSIINYLEKHKDKKLSIEDISNEISLSKVTLRRYMNYLVEQEVVANDINYSTGGRPSIVYTYIKE